MRNVFLKGLSKLQRLTGEFIHDESGQDLIEYALVVALIALAATAGMTSVAGSINTGFSKIASKLTTYTS
jgi:pilus assembly protein Flp/PilA